MGDRDERTTRAEGSTDGESLPSLVARLGDDIVTLLDTKLSLLKVEVKEDVDTYLRNGLAVVGGGVVAAVGFALLNVALAFFVARLFDGAALSGPVKYACGFLVVGVPYLLAGVVVVSRARQRFARTDLMPTKTLEELEKDKQLLR